MIRPWPDKKNNDHFCNWVGHKWSGWPGALCTVCFIEDPWEMALADGVDPELIPTTINVLPCVKSLEGDPND